MYADDIFMDLSSSKIYPTLEQPKTQKINQLRMDNDSSSLSIEKVEKNNRNRQVI